MVLKMIYLGRKSVDIDKIVQKLIDGFLITVAVMAIAGVFLAFHQENFWWLALILPAILVLP